MPANIATEIAALHHMTTNELAEWYKELHGQSIRKHHRTYLISKIAWRIQANAESDLTERARKRAAELANDAEVRVTAPKTLIFRPSLLKRSSSTGSYPTASTTIRACPRRGRPSSVSTRGGPFA